MTVDGESVSDSQTITLKQGDTAHFAVSLDGVSVLSDAHFAVYNPDVIRVENGVITALGVGSSTVILTYIDSDNITYTYIITIEVESAEITLLENGVSEYSIVVPHETYLTMKDYNGNASGYSTTQSSFCNDALRVAAEELRVWFYEATGVYLNIVSDSGLTHAEGQKYISLGNTALYLSSGAMLTAEEKAKISSDGSKIFSRSENIYLIGGTDKGTCFAVYEWMNDLFAYDCFSRDCYYIDDSLKNESEVENKTLNIQSVNKLVLPSIAVRGHSIEALSSATPALAGRAYGSLEAYGFTGEYNTYVYKYRLRLSDDIYFPIHTDTSSTNSRNKIVHNTLEFLASSDAEYEAFINGTKPLDQKWVWDVDTNDSTFDICFSANGDATSYASMVAHFANKILFSLKTYTEETHPAYNTVTIAQEDGWGTQACSCATCVELTAKYGASYAGLKFVNDVANKLDELLVGENAQYRRNDFHLLYFAYGSRIEAPACTEACTAADIAAFNTFKSNLNECVGVYMATSAFSYFNDIDAEVNENAKEIALNWGDWIADKGGMTLWTYSTNFLGYLYYFDSIAFYEAKAYQFFAEDCGVYYWKNQNQSGQYGVSAAFSNLQLYLDYQLMWDCNQDSEELIVKWFKNKFGDAWDEMFAVFNRMRADFRETVMPGATYDGATANANGFIDYNIVGAADEITMGTAAYGAFTLNDISLGFTNNGKNVVYSVEDAMDWLQMFDTVYAAFEAQMASEELTETDLDYQILKKAIDTEWLAPAYAVLNRANTSLLSYATSTDGQKSVQLMALKTQFKETVFRTRLVRLCEHAACFNYSSFAENALFFETLGYRGIMSSASTLLSMRAKVGDESYLTLSGMAQRGVTVGEEITLAPNASGTNFQIGACTFTVSSEGILSEISSTDTTAKYTAVASGEVTVTMTYTLDGITHTTTGTITVS